MEEEMRTVKTEQADGMRNEGELSNNTPSKRGRGRPQGSKKLKVCVTDVNLMELVSGISNGGSTQPQRGRGRPKLSSTKETVQVGSRDDHADNSVQTHKGKGSPRGSKKEASNGGSPTTDLSPRKRGRPKKSLSQSIVQKVAAEDLPNGGSNSPKVGRGRPKGSTKRKLESLRGGAEDVGSPATPRKRGRPKGSLNKKRRLEAEVSSEGEAETDASSQTRVSRLLIREEEDASNGISNTPRRGRGRPRKYFDNKKRNQKLLADGSEPIKRGRGRPKGSLNKKRPAFKLVQHGTVSRPRRVHVSPPKERPGRPKKSAKRGRPRKYPLPLPEDRQKKPKVWKPLGRPRKYPRVDPPEGAPAAPPRRPGRPRKSESKRGAHLRKNLPPTPSSARNATGGPPRKRGRPPSTAKSADVTPRKRGRPKGSLNKNKAGRETQLDSTLSNHSKGQSDASAVLLLEGGPIEEEMEDDTQTTTAAAADADADAEEMLIEQDATFEVSNQA